MPSSNITPDGTSATDNSWTLVSGATKHAAVLTQGDGNEIATGVDAFYQAFSMSDLPAGVGRVNTVNMGAVLKAGDITNLVKLYYRNATTRTTPVSAGVLTGAYVTYTQLVNAYVPGTTLLVTPAQFNGYEFGLLSQIASSTVSCDRLVVTVNYDMQPGSGAFLIASLVGAMMLVHELPRLVAHLATMGIFYTPVEALELFEEIRNHPRRVYV